MKNFNTIAHLAFMGALFPEAFSGFKKSSNVLTEDEIREKNKKNLLSKGVKEWTIDGISVLALNRKNAIRKVNKIKELNQ